MKRQFGLLVSLLILPATFFLMSGSALAAAPAQILTLSPATENIVLQKGSVNKGTFEVINQGQSSYNFTVYGAPYHVSGEDYQPGFTYLPGAANVVNWFHFSTTSASITPGQSVSVDYTITVPTNVQPGGYYAVAFAQTQQPPAANSVTVNERAGLIFYMQVAGPATEKGALLSWQVKFLQTPPLTTTIKLNNTGSVHYFSNINLKVKDIFGSTKYSFNTQKALLPQTVRLVTLTWPKSPSIGLFKVSGSLTIFNQTKTVPTHYVLVMSHTVQIIVLVVIALIILGLIARLVTRRRRHKRVKH